MGFGGGGWVVLSDKIVGFRKKCAIFAAEKTIGAMTQIERITEMERHLAVAQRALASMAVALDEYESSLSSLAALRDYYGSESWRQDFSADEAGRLPRGLNRGVLSEDGIWNVLEDWRSTERRLSALAGSA